MTVVLPAPVPPATPTTSGRCPKTPLAVSSRLGRRAWRERRVALEHGGLAFTPQAEAGVTYAHKIDKAEARIDWRKPASHVHNLIRGLAPFPGAFFEADLGKGLERVKVFRTRITQGAGMPGGVLDDGLTIACGEGAVRLLVVQRAGKVPMPAGEFLRGARLSRGMLLAPKTDAAL